MTPPDRLRVRLERERSILLQAYPTATLDIDGLFVILPGHPLPAGWSHSSTDVLFVVPPNYPSGQPDNVCARPDLTLADGQPAGNNQGLQEYAGRSWLQFSYHVEAEDWRPRSNPANGTTLADYLTGALTRFEEAS